jgi:hypothetical protein
MMDKYIEVEIDAYDDSRTSPVDGFATLSSMEAAIAAVDAARSEDGYVIVRRDDLARALFNWDEVLTDDDHNCYQRLKEVLRER